MAERRKNVHIERKYEETYKIYSDLTVKEIESVQGVVSVNDSSMSFYGYLTFSIDKRYNSREVIEEIEWAAKQKSER